MGGEIERVARLVVCDILKRPPPKDGAVPGNPWGAMPSDHISSAAITAMGLAEIGPIFGAIGWSYAAAAAFAIVDLGEHYVADVVVGLLARRGRAPRRAARGTVRASRRAVWSSKRSHSPCLPTHPPTYMTLGVVNWPMTKPRHRPRRGRRRASRRAPRPSRARPRDHLRPRRRTS